MRYEPKKDPRVRRDGLCYVCRKPRPEPRTRAMRQVLDADPFCSTVCCKQYHGIAITPAQMLAARDARS